MPLPSYNPYGSPPPAPGEPGRLATSMGIRPQQQNFQQTYGGMTPAMALERRNAGAPVGPQPAGGAQPQPQLTSQQTARPEEAGAMNAAMPGIFNGNTANGHRSDLTGEMPETGGSATLANAARSMMQAQAQPPAQQPMQPMPTFDPLRAQAGEQYSQQAATPDSPGAAPLTAPPSAGTASESGWYNRKGVEKSWVDADWQKAKSMGIDPLDYLRYDDNPAQGFYNLANIQDGKKRFGELPELSNYGLDVPWDTAAGEFSDMNRYAGLDPALAELMTKFNQLGSRIHNVNDGMQEAGNYGPDQITDLQQKANAIQTLLSRYGINYNPRGSGVSSGDEQGQGGEQQANDQQSGGDQGQGEGQPSGTQYDGNAYQAEGSGETTGNRTNLDIDNTDLATTLPGMSGTIVSDIKRAFSDMNGVPQEQRAAMLEMAMQRYMTEDAMRNKQKGVNVIQDQIAANNSNPLRDQSLSTVKSFFDDPSGVDYDGIRNRYVADSDAGYQNLTDQIAQNMGARGMSAASGSGMQAEGARDLALRQARGLGELTTEEQVANREGQYRALAAAGAHDQNYRGQDNIMSQILANAIMGTPQAAMNPYSGIADQSANVLATRLAREQYEDAQDDSGFGGIAGSLLGAAAGGLLGGMPGASLGSNLGGQVGGLF